MKLFLLLVLLCALIPRQDVCHGKNGDDEYCILRCRCAIGEGDCDEDADCEGDLRCGSNNCDRALKNGKHYVFDSTDDCCY